jgi:putative colanic acid biosynthesis UDP-glucose lipid carrier transferase
LKNRYSQYIRPLQLLIDMLIVIVTIYLINDFQFLNVTFLFYIIFFWILSSYYTGFYKVYRFTTVFRIFTLLAVQFSIFILGFFAFFGILKEGVIVNNQFIILSIIIFGITFFKFSSFYVLGNYRSRGNNYRKIVFIGLDSSTKKMTQLFNKKSNLGYRYLGFFSDKKSDKKEKLGSFKDSFNFISDKTNFVDEVYCSLTELNKEQLKEVVRFTNDKDIVVKMIPNSEEFYSKHQNVEYYGETLKVLSVRKLPFDFVENHLVKRFFDIIFSLLVCLFVLSWLIPILWVLVIIESKGPLLFKQKREGLNGEQFLCYKFRSMKLNEVSDKVHTSKNDNRVTKIGGFLRKTSIDELPQFFNVLEGAMSVVGPRPHLKSLSQEYQKEVGDYLKRHVVKPGITGLAQVSGYRGEIKKRSDIKNRVRLDIFYIENWSFFLDIKIVLKTIFNVFKGEEKAY